MSHVQDQMFETPFILRGLAAEKYFDAAFGRTFRLEANADQRQMYTLLLSADVHTQYLNTRRAQCVALAEVIKKFFPIAAVYLAFHLCCLHMFFSPRKNISPRLFARVPCRSPAAFVHCLANRLK